ncbi:MAG: metallophosphoesterase family protein [Candidatus Lokiarchaeota archaeon]|nr:metallophosphoesterase family protein [Candidatus Lokiarchaeota archaeon]
MSIKKEMAKFGIISDTHFTTNDKDRLYYNLLNQLEETFKDVDEIIHAGDVCESFFLEDLRKIAPVRCVEGESDKIPGLEHFINFKVGQYTLGIIHKKPENTEVFFKERNINILIFGHTHQPLIKGTPYNTLLINPGSPTKPLAPPPKKGFEKPLARPSVITLKIDSDSILSTFLINLNLR